MICELCKQENPVSCDHGKNGYCLLFGKQAEKDIRLHGPKNLKTLADLQPNDTFRYQNSDENDWYTVMKVDQDRIYYAGYLPDKPYTNYRVENVEVIVK